MSAGYQLCVSIFRASKIDISAFDISNADILLRFIGSVKKQFEPNPTIERALNSKCYPIMQFEVVLRMRKLLEEAVMQS